MPCRWNGADARAVVPAVSAQSASEVLTATPHLVLASPGAFCVGLYARASALPMRYVPSAAARALRVRGGWYVPQLAVGTPFAVVVTPTLGAARAAQRRGADALAVYVDVGGVRAHPRGREFDLSKLHEYVLPGFTLRADERSVDGDSHIVERTFREFAFTSQPFDIVVSARGARYGVSRPVAGNVGERCAERSLPPAAGAMRHSRRYVRAEQRVLLGLWEVPQFRIVVHVRPSLWLIERGVFDVADLDPPLWLDGCGQAYCGRGMSVAVSNENSESSLGKKVSGDESDNDSIQALTQFNGVARDMSASTRYA